MIFRSCTYFLLALVSITLLNACNSQTQKSDEVAQNLYAPEGSGYSIVFGMRPTISEDPDAKNVAVTKPMANIPTIPRGDIL